MPLFLVAQKGPLILSTMYVYLEENVVEKTKKLLQGKLNSQTFLKIRPV